MVSDLSNARQTIGKVFANEISQRIDLRHAPEALAAHENNSPANPLPFELPIADQILQTIVRPDSKPGNETITKAGSNKVA